MTNTLKNSSRRSTVVYDALSTINRAFEEILCELERIQQFDRFRRAPIKSAELAVRENHAWVMFEILEVQHEQEESEWTRLGRLRAAEETRSERRQNVPIKTKSRKRLPRLQNVRAGFVED